MGHSIIKCDNCGSLIMEGYTDTWDCDNCGWTYHAHDGVINDGDNTKSIKRDLIGLIDEDNPNDVSVYNDMVKTVETGVNVKKKHEKCMQLLKLCVNVFNRIPNTKLNFDGLMDTYELAAMIDKELLEHLNNRGG